MSAAMCKVILPETGFYCGGAVPCPHHFTGPTRGDEWASLVFERDKYHRQAQGLEKDLDLLLAASRPFVDCVPTATNVRDDDGSVRRCLAYDVDSYQHRNLWDRHNEHARRRVADFPATPGDFPATFRRQKSDSAVTHAKPPEFVHPSHLKTFVDLGLYECSHGLTGPCSQCETQQHEVHR